MNAIDIEKLNQLISRTDISGNDKVRWLTDFMDGREFQLTQNEFYSDEEVEFIETLISFYWSNYNNGHPNNLKDFELSKSILETFKKK